MKFRVGDKERKREDDHLATFFCYGIVIALGDSKSF
jgi:hypothetical protein